MPQRFFEDEIDNLVLATLRKDSASVDIKRMLRDAERRNRRKLTGVSAWNRVRTMVNVRRISIAACILLAIVGTWWVLPPNQTSAYSILKATETEANSGIDRCYRLDAHVPQAWGRNNPLIRKGWETLVWTRGDRFCAIMKAPGRELIWGQDEKHNVWLVRDANLGLNYTQDETPPMLAKAKSYLCLDVGRLTNRFLNYFDLTHERPLPADGPKAAIIRAMAKPEYPNFPLNGARLVIDLDTNVIRKMDLLRVIDGKVQGTLSFTLMERSAKPDSTYRLDGYLSPSGEILSDDRAAERIETFQELLGVPGKAN
jgi:hypothetical protein